MVNMFSALHLSPANLVPAKVIHTVVVEAWRAAVREATDSPVCLPKRRGGEDPKACRSYKNALALAARAVQDRYVREWWDAEMARVLKSHARDNNNKKGWRSSDRVGSENGRNQEDEDEERMRTGARGMKAALDSFCIGL